MDVKLGDFLQYGAFGLIAMLWVWMLLKGIPAFLERQEIRDNKRDEILDRLAKTFKEEMTMERAACERRDERFTQTLKESTNELTQTLRSISRAVDTIKETVRQHDDVTLKTAELLASPQKPPEGEKK